MFWFYDILEEDQKQFILMLLLLTHLPPMKQFVFGAIGLFM